MANLSLSVVEIMVLMLGAIVLGITIHFFITSRRNLKEATSGSDNKTAKSLEDWKLRYFNDIEQRDKELAELRNELTGLRQRHSDAEENNQINMIEAEEAKAQNKLLRAELENARRVQPQPAAPIVQDHKPDYMQQLRDAQHSLLEHNEKINLLLSQIDIVKETEEKQQEMIKNNEELSGQITELKSLLAQREREVNNIRQKEHLTKEMTTMLDSAYSDFNTLQNKIHKLESQVNTSKMLNLEYEDLKEAHYKMGRDFDEQKLKYNSAVTANQQLLSQLTEMEEKFREANFQRQQLQKRVAYLEELNNDMLIVSEANKKLETQIKRIGELESMLNVVSEERDELAKRQQVE